MSKVIYYFVRIVTVNNLSRTVKTFDTFREAFEFMADFNNDALARCEDSLTAAPPTAVKEDPSSVYDPTARQENYIFPTRRI